jgi:hypothetical protein
MTLISTNTIEMTGISGICIERDDGGSYIITNLKIPSRHKVILFLLHNDIRVIYSPNGVVRDCSLTEYANTEFRGLPLVFPLCIKEKSLKVKDAPLLDELRTMTNFEPYAANQFLTVDNVDELSKSEIKKRVIDMLFDYDARNPGILALEIDYNHYILK